MSIVKEYVINLVATLVFITAVELIAPENNMKKYLKFILGLILVSVLLTPIIKFLTSGEKVLEDVIEKYEDEAVSITTESSNEKIYESRKESFIKNFNNNCEKLLNEKYKNRKFTCSLNCNVDFDKGTFSVNELKITVKNQEINDIEKVIIGKVDKNTNEDDNFQKEVKDFLCKELNINKEKIKVIYS